MPKYRIAIMPGDGIGNDVMDAAKIVLDKIALDAEYVPADIGWEFWRTEGEPLPQRTLDTLKTCDCALFAAITSKPKEEAAAELIPELQGKLTGYAMRVPVINGSVVDLTVNLKKSVTEADVNAAIKAAAEGPLKGILFYAVDPIVSTDIIGDSHSSIFASDFTQVLDGNMLKVVSWYDNEWGYSCRTVDLIEKMAAL